MLEYFANAWDWFYSRVVTGFIDWVGYADNLALLLIVLAILGGCGYLLKR